ncbi:unnamed protein product [Sphagnum balticum]
MDNKKIADASSGMMPGERDRLYKNRWVDPGEEHGYLTYEECLKCRDLTLTERTYGERFCQYYAIIDYGGVNDRCSLCIMHLQYGSTSAIVDRLDCWQGSHDNRIAILEDRNNNQSRSVQGWIEVVRKNFNLSALIVDPAQMEGLAIYYERIGIRILRFEYRGGKANYRMAQILKTSIQSNVVKWSANAGRLPDTYMENGRNIPIEDTTLEQELSMLITKPTMWGYRFDHESGRHDDRAVVLGMGLLHAFPEGVPLSVGPQIVENPDKQKPVLGNTRHSKNSHDIILPDSVIGSPHRWNLFGMSGNNNPNNPGTITGPSKWDNGDID